MCIRDSALPALRSLIRIDESEHDWPRAIEAVKTLHGLVDEPVPQIVHYYCEQASTALAAKPPNVDAAHAALDAADHALSTADAGMSSKGTVVRTAMLRARLALIEQDPKRERLYLESVMTDAAEYAGLVAEQLLANYRAAGQAEAGLELLQRQYARHASLDLFNVVFRELRVQQLSLIHISTAALAPAEPAGQRPLGHRGRPGHQHSAPQPPGSGRRLPVLPAQSRVHGR